MDAIEEHNQKMMAAFAEVLRAEDGLSSAKKELDEATNELTRKKNAAEAALAAAWAAVEQLMKETGEVETLLPGEVTDFRIGWSKPRESVKVEPEAVPDEFCKMERKPRLKEIGEYLDGLREAGQPLPNWARFEMGATKLGWKAVKKTAA